MILSAAYLLSLIDRMAFGIMMEPIRQSLGLTDTGVSLLQGMAFLIFYSIAGIPLGALADRVNRMRLIGMGLIFWSCATGVSGLASSFAFMFAARMAVGVGEASLSPAAYSLLASSFKPEQIGLAFGIYALGGALGSGLALLAGGTAYGALEVHFGTEAWRYLFFLLAAPGIALGIVFLFTPEGPRRGSGIKYAGTGTLRDFYATNWRKLILHHLHYAFALGASFSAMAWIAPFFSRVHGWPIQQTGLTIGLVTMVAGALGYVGAGTLSDRLGATGLHARILVSTVASLLIVATGHLFPLVASPWLASGLFGIFVTAAIASSGISTVVLQILLPETLRGKGAALLMIVGNALSAICTTVIAMLSDGLFTSTGGIGPSIAWVATGCGIASTVSGLLFYRTCQPARAVA